MRQRRGEVREKKEKNGKLVDRKSGGKKRREAKSRWRGRKEG